MTPQAKQIHDANAERIRIEREAMAARWLKPKATEPARIKIRCAIGEAEIVPVREARRCMRCDRPFVSCGPNHRLCAACRRRTGGIGEVQAP